MVMIFHVLVLERGKKVSVRKWRRGGLTSSRSSSNSGNGRASDPTVLQAPKLHVLTRAQSLPCILGAYKGQGNTLNGSGGGRHISG